MSSSSSCGKLVAKRSNLLHCVACQSSELELLHNISESGCGTIMLLEPCHHVICSQCYYNPLTLITCCGCPACGVIPSEAKNIRTKLMVKAAEKRKKIGSSGSSTTPPRGSSVLPPSIEEVPQVLSGTIFFPAQLSQTSAVVNPVDYHYSSEVFTSDAVSNSESSSALCATVVGDDEEAINSQQQQLAQQEEVKSMTGANRSSSDDASSSCSFQTLLTAASVYNYPQPRILKPGTDPPHSFHLGCCAF